MKRSKKAKMVIRVILFFAIFIFLFQNISLLFVFKGGDPKRRLRGFYQETKNSIDVVLVGPSSVYPFFIPGYAYQKHGFVTYNYAVPAMTVSMTHYTLEEVKRMQDPKLYVIDIRGVIQEKPTISEVQKRRMIDNMALGSAKLDAIYNLVDQEDRISYYLGIIKYHERWKELNDIDYEVLLRKTDPVKGYDSRTKILSLGEKAWTGTTQDREPIAVESEKSVCELLTYCKENNINALFTAAPWCMTESMKKRQNYLKDIVESYGYPFLDANDYYEELNWDFDTDMGDEKHSNINGATKYTNFLTDYLAEHYDLEDRRQDPKYEEWNEAYNLYLKPYAKMQKKLKSKRLKEIKNNQ